MVNKNATIYNSCPSYNKRIRPQIKVLIELLNDVYDLGIILEAEIKYFGNGDGWSCGYEGLWFCLHFGHLLWDSMGVRGMRRLTSPPP
jgi:hypothetical protein